MLKRRAHRAEYLYLEKGNRQRRVGGDGAELRDGVVMYRDQKHFYLVLLALRDGLVVAYHEPVQQHLVYRHRDILARLDRHDLASCFSTVAGSLMMEIRLEEYGMDIAASCVVTLASRMTSLSASDNLSAGSDVARPISTPA